MSLQDRANDIIRDALVVEDFCTEADIHHIRGCGQEYGNGSPCTCGLPELKRSLRAFDNARAAFNRRLARVAHKAG